MPAGNSQRHAGERVTSVHGADGVMQASVTATHDQTVAILQIVEGHVDVGRILCVPQIRTHSRRELSGPVAVVVRRVRAFDQDPVSHQR